MSSLKDQILGPPSDPNATIAAAMKAVEAAQNALESAYVMLLTTARAISQPQVTRSEDPTQCEHPKDARIVIQTMGGRGVLCDDCGAEVSDE